MTLVNAEMETEKQRISLPFGFTAPEIAKLGTVKFLALLDAIMQPDWEALATMRAEFSLETTTFDHFVIAVDLLASGEYKAAAAGFAKLEMGHWHIPAAILRIVALAADGAMRPAIALSNRIRDLVDASHFAGSLNYTADHELLSEATRCLILAEEPFPLPTGPVQTSSPFWYVISYPRSGSHFFIQFLQHAFDVPSYSVYPGDTRYFSRKFYSKYSSKPIFVKDHVLNTSYIENNILAPVRDGRFSVISLARFLYAEGFHTLIGRDDLADFLSFLAEKTPFGFWGQHTCSILDAQDRGARIRLIRYEEVIGNHQRLVTLAREINNGAAVPHEDETGCNLHRSIEKRKLSTQKRWSERIELPKDSFIPQNWSIGGETIDWRRAFDKPARRRFHELGGTEMLIRLGYETDGGWWRRS